MTGRGWRELWVRRRRGGWGWGGGSGGWVTSGDREEMFPTYGIEMKDDEEEEDEDEGKDGKEKGMDG